jgi:hypothetical protein
MTLFNVQTIKLLKIDAVMLDKMGKKPHKEKNQ